MLAAVDTVESAATDDPEKDPRMGDFLQEARHLVDTRRAAAAVNMCDKVVAAYKANYGNRREKVFCARAGPASLGTLLSAATKNQNAIVLSSTWADAYFIKAYALQELGRLSEAKASVQKAIALAPFESHYLCEARPDLCARKELIERERTV